MRTAMGLHRCRAATVGVVAVAACCVLISACEHVGPLDPNAVQPTLTSIQENVFSVNCALSGCHAGTAPQQGMNLSEGNARSNIVGVRSNERPDLFRIEAGNPDQSYLIKKVEGASDILGARMPLGRAPLTAVQIAVLRQWVEDGALDN